MNRRLVVLVLAAIAVLAGCGAGDPNEPAPSTPIPTRTIAPSTLSPATTLVSGLPRQVGTDGNFQEPKPGCWPLHGRGPRRVPAACHRQKLRLGGRPTTQHRRVAAPMLAAVGPVLGDGRAVGYRSKDGATAWFGYQDGAVTLGGHRDTSLVPSRPARLRRPRPPVAVLTSRLTGSAGEGVAMAFRGRPGARSFGEPTAGVPTGDSQHRLSDGAELYLTEGIGVDRTGRGYQTRIISQRS